MTAPEGARPAGLYLHVPFCRQRCSYCAFVTWADRMEGQEAYFVALRREVAARCAGRTLDTVYFGGGTPSLPDPSMLASVLEAVREVATILPGAEITLEANPESVDEARAAAWREAGINRASVGVQSFDPAVLEAAGRLHGPDGPRRAFAAFRSAGFDNLSLDLIAGLPHETSQGLADSRRRALDLAPEHVSLYLLELDEAGKTTPLSTAVKAGRVTVASGDELADWYEASREAIEGASLPAYEISNFAGPGRQSRHNLKYWRCEPVIGCGVAAHWHDGGIRRFNLSGFESWMAAVHERGDGEAPESRDPAQPADAAQERVMLGLRLAEGIDLAAIDRELPGSAARFEPVIREHLAHGLLERVGTRIRLTLRGCLLSNEVLQDVVAA